MNQKVVSKPHIGSLIGIPSPGGVQASREFQIYLDEIELRINKRLLGNQIVLASYEVDNLPPVPDVSEPGLIFVSNEIGGSVPAFSDGTNWRG